jgi:hypothetical protein
MLRRLDGEPRDEDGLETATSAALDTEVDDRDSDDDGLRPPPSQHGSCPWSRWTCACVDLAQLPARWQTEIVAGQRGKAKP